MVVVRCEPTRVGIIGEDVVESRGAAVVNEHDDGVGCPALTWCMNASACGFAPLWWLVGCVWWVCTGGRAWRIEEAEDIVDAFVWAFEEIVIVGASSAVDVVLDVRCCCRGVRAAPRWEGEEGVECHCCLLPAVGWVVAVVLEQCCLRFPRHC